MSEKKSAGLFIQRAWNRLGVGGAPTPRQDVQAGNYHDFVLHEHDSHLPPSVARVIADATRRNSVKVLGADFVNELELEHAAEPPHHLGLPQP
ncbi:MAG TPA: hypothetical protein VEW42_00850 [Candidatus Eisenbacteria bacterium]|nr:hypothetical protein [Candidatus Eisenbacteria bacterium]